MDYRWEISPDIQQLLIRLEAIKIVGRAQQLSPAQFEHLRAVSVLKSAVYSARIEGFTDTEQQPKREAQNLVRAYRMINRDSHSRFTTDLLRKLHRLVLSGINATAGSWRAEPWAVFNEAGVAIYLAPLHTKVPELMQQYVAWMETLTDHPAVVAAVGQFVFEKIHPFADGNGRVGRLISAWWLHRHNFSLNGLAPLEEYIEKHREHYYIVLEPARDVTEFIQFFLTALVEQAQAAVSIPNISAPSLLPRRQELLDIIRDHPQCTFDFLQRRFLSINPKTLHYDLQQLQKQSLVRKIGVSRGSVYETISF